MHVMPQIRNTHKVSSFVSRRFVLDFDQTANSHCQGAFNYGVLILNERTNDFTRLVQIDRQIRHPEWSISRQHLNHDVLVLKLATPLSSTDVAKPIANLNDSNTYPNRNQSLRAYGFGLTEDKAVVRSDSSACANSLPFMF